MNEDIINEFIKLKENLSFFNFGYKLKINKYIKILKNLNLEYDENEYIGKSIEIYEKEIFFNEAKFKMVWNINHLQNELERKNIKMITKDTKELYGLLKNDVKMIEKDIKLKKGLDIEKLEPYKAKNSIIILPFMVSGNPYMIANGNHRIVDAYKKRTKELNVYWINDFSYIPSLINKNYRTLFKLIYNYNIINTYICYNKRHLLMPVF